MEEMTLQSRVPASHIAKGGTPKWLDSLFAEYIKLMPVGGDFSQSALTFSEMLTPKFTF